MKFLLAEDRSTDMDWTADDAGEGTSSSSSGGNIADMEYKKKAVDFHLGGRFTF